MSQGAATTRAPTGCVVWLTGLPAAGKSTLARALCDALRARGGAALLLDGDDVRAALVPAPGYDDRGRADFYATLGRLAALVASQGLVVVVAATAHLRQHRDAARALGSRFVEVHVATPLAECRRRDPKGLYARSAADPASTLPGAGVGYEPPLAPEVTVPAGLDGAAVKACLAAIEGLG